MGTSYEAIWVMQTVIIRLAKMSWHKYTHTGLAQLKLLDFLSAESADRHGRCGKSLHEAVGCESMFVQG